MPKDEHKAAEFYGKAAHRWSAASYNLAMLCESGRGVPQDKAAAIWSVYRDALSFSFPEQDAWRGSRHWSGTEFKIPATGKEQNDEAGALLAHDKDKRAKTPCDP